MDVSAEAFEATRQGLRGDMALKGVQKRISPRVGLKGTLKFWPVQREKGAKAIEVRARDVSLKGLSVVAGVAMPQGARYAFFLRFSGEPSREPLAFLCTARHCSPLPGGGNYVIGFSMGDLESLNKSRVKPDEIERIRGEILR